MSAKYTQGRVKVQHPHAGERGWEVAFEPGLEQLCQDITEANARRLVALAAQRDELLAALKDLLAALKDLLNYDNLGAYERANARQQARAAVAEVKGEQA